MSEWKSYPLHQPDPGQYIVAIPFHGQIVYAVGEWKDGEWIRLFEDDRVIAFMPFPKYEGTKKGTTETETNETPHHS